MAAEFDLPLESDAFTTAFCTQLSLSTIKKNSAAIFKDQPQFQSLQDVLNRKYVHHALLNSSLSKLATEYFLSAFFLHLQQAHVSQQLHHAVFLMIDTDIMLSERNDDVQFFFTQLNHYVSHATHCVVIAVSDVTIFLNQDHILFQLLNQLSQHPNCRLLLFHHKKNISLALQSDFYEVHLPALTHNQIIQLLKQERLILESFHQVNVPDILVETAHNLSQCYLSQRDVITKTLLLLDSAAARAKQKGFEKNLTTLNVTQQDLYDVLSNWTQIPATHLGLQHFNVHEFAENFRERVFGQETAVQHIGQHLLQSQMQLQKKSGPFCVLHFAGENHTGKRTAAICLTEQLFKQLNLLFIAEPISEKCTSLFQLTFERATDKHVFSLAEILQTQAYAVLFLAFNKTIPEALQNALHTLLTTGTLMDASGVLFNLHQTFIIVSTTIGCDTLRQFDNQSHQHEEKRELDLLQLIVTENKSQTAFHKEHISNEIIEMVQAEVDASMPTIAALLPLVPFAPLTISALEKIIQLKLKLLGKLLEAKFNIELRYAPEIVRYLLHDKHMQDKSVDIEKTLNKLYMLVEQAIFHQRDNSNGSNQLLLQLNETGQQLRYEWLAKPMRQA